jgi:hypothetical protein
MRGTKGPAVHLTLYDLSPWNAFGYQLGLGIFRSGIELDGLEYTFDGNKESNASGVTWHVPFHADVEHANTMLRERIELGHAKMLSTEAHDRLRSLAEEWMAMDYDALELNCHHWVDAAANALGVSAPRYIHGLVRVLRFCTGAAFDSRSEHVQPLNRTSQHRTQQAQCTCMVLLLVIATLGLTARVMRAQPSQLPQL